VTVNIPLELRHNFTFDLELTMQSAEDKRVHRCAHCKAWVTEEEKQRYVKNVCPARDRRDIRRRKHEDRRAQWNQALAQAYVLQTI
jgi:hypothetical protein